MKGKHWICCVHNYPKCPCVTCAKDNMGESDEPCCDKHCILCAAGARCEDYVREEK